MLECSVDFCAQAGCDPSLDLQEKVMRLYQVYSEATAMGLCFIRSSKQRGRWGFILLLVETMGSQLHVVFVRGTALGL